MTNLKYGWIGLYRSISNHWIYPQNREFTKFEAWIDLLLMVNHQDNKIFNGADLEICKKGETITSLSKLMNRWKWSKSKLLRFLNLLKNDSMIEYLSDTKKTTIKVCNYYNYQDFNQIGKIKKTDKRPMKDRPKTDQRPIKDTNNNDNNVNNENNDIIREVFDDFLEMRKKIKKPATPRAIELLKKKLSELSNNDENLAVKILEQSTLNDWQDLYPLKNNHNPKAEETKVFKLSKDSYGN